MKNKIFLNNETPVDIPKLIEGGMVILANSGGGKSYAIRKLAEEAVGQVQVIILDPEGEFASLREKFDFILAGKNADVPVEVRSASLFAHRLLEIGKSAVIDLYELHPQERQRYVKNFCEALVNAPKELYHPVLIVLDEAHEYVPEGKPSEATWAVESLASRGRKRGQRLILASQRISKLSKNVSAECNNKLIGRASQDIDMKRAGDELGFNKEKLVQLRQLKPGEFFAFGPAISDEVVKMKVGEVKTAHAKVAYGSNRVPPPSSTIKKVLSELANLPKEAEKEAKTLKELKEENRQLKSHRCPKVDHDPKAIERAVEVATQKLERRFSAELKAIFHKISQAKKILPEVDKSLEALLKPVTLNAVTAPKIFENARKVLQPLHKPYIVKRVDLIEPTDEEAKPITGGALRMLKVLVSRHPIKLTKFQLGTFSKMKPTSGTFGTYLSTLKSQGLVEMEGDLIFATQAGIDYTGDAPSAPQSPEEVIAMWKDNLSGGSKRMFEVLVENHPETLTKEVLGQMAEMSHRSGTFGTYLSILRSNGLIDVKGEEISLSNNLFI